MIISSYFCYSFFLGSFPPGIHDLLVLCYFPSLSWLSSIFVGVVRRSAAYAYLTLFCRVSYLAMETLVFLSIESSRTRLGDTFLDAFSSSPPFSDLCLYFIFSVPISELRLFSASYWLVKRLCWNALRLNHVITSDTRVFFLLPFES